MKMKFVNVEGRGVLDKERLVFRALRDVDIGDYTVLRCWSAEDDGKPLAGEVDLAYWFNIFTIKANDMIVLYTKDGKRSEKEIGDGRKSHFFYWGRAEPLWDQKHVPVLVEGPEWTFIEEDENTREPGHSDAASKTG